MAIEIRVPQMGESVTEGVIATWLKAEGDTVAADEPLVEVETDKITVEVNAPAAGVLKALSAPVGQTVSVGQVIGLVDSSNGASAHSASPGPEAKAPAEPQPTKPTPPTSAPAVTPIVAMPAARAEAHRTGIALESVSGTGRGGRVLKEDVTREAQAKPVAQSPREAPAEPSVAVPSNREVRKAMTSLRRRVAERLVEAQNTAAILTTFNELDMSAVMDVRSRWKDAFLEQHGVKLGFMSFFVKAAVLALKEFPAVNAEIDGNDVVYKHYYDIGVAVGSGKGLVVPVIRDADRLTFAEIEKAIGEFGGKAKSNKLTLDDLSGGTFTISNGGVYGSMMSTPIINPPQTGILGLHNIVERPVAIAGKVEIRPIMYLALSYDHRLIDGREAVQFLVRIKTSLEQPERLFLGV